ncbi:hypothetical protein RchiOBHm_Chr7g0213771 [Rosa chinensis]|uniref:Uncharacterized protein n=1 Tax=Rosa chinensis TaxID=74649 RepID=A0A2P6PB25_ROSCH|nr:hypothetical protein RchiOBHm_Chr7g0213771 [Rosa chinensis]
MLDWFSVICSLCKSSRSEIQKSKGQINLRLFWRRARSAARMRFRENS